MEVLYASGIKCLSTLTHKYSSPYDFVYMGDDIEKIKIKPDSDTEDCFSKAASVLGHTPFVMKVKKQEMVRVNST